MDAARVMARDCAPALLAVRMAVVRMSVLMPGLIVLARGPYRQVDVPDPSVFRGFAGMRVRQGSALTYDVGKCDKQR
jgi:hypothetical protein